MRSTQTSIQCSIIRGGTSRGVYFAADDMPADEERRNAILLSIMGGPDVLQVDGIGGGHALTNKVAIVRPSHREDADVDYLFLQVNRTEQSISTSQNCGNILAGVGVFAIDAGWVSVQDTETVVRVHMVNSGNLAELVVPTAGKIVQYDGDTRIDGVPGAGAPVVCNFLDVAGSVSGSMFPTGHVRDEIDGVAVTCIDNGMPVVIVRADSFGRIGTESPEELDADDALKVRLEALRQKAGEQMGLGDVSTTTVPKMCLVSPPAAGGNISTRMFIPHVCHRAIGVLGAVSVGTACLVPGSVATELAAVPTGTEKQLAIEHPSGRFEVQLTIDPDADIESFVTRAGVIRTARTIMRGSAMVPAALLEERM